MSYKLFFTILILFLITAIGAAGIFLLLRSNNTQVKKTVAQKPQQQDFTHYAWIAYWDQERGMETVYENPEVFDAVGLFWYKLSENGEIVPYKEVIEDRRFVEFAHENDIKVLALIANLPEEGEQTEEWDPLRVDRVIRTPQARQQHIQDLRALVVYNNFDGLALDYENLRAEQRDDFSVFVEELAEALHEEGKTLEVAIHPKTSDDLSQFQGARAQDYGRLARVVDKMHFMMYTQNGTHSQPAPTTTLDWAEDVLEFAHSQEVPDEKIVFGVGLTGAHWQINERSFEGTSSDLTFEYITQELSRRENVNTIRDENTQSLESSYTEDDTFHVVWYNDAESVHRMVAYAKEKNVSGVSFWRLGGEDPNVWTRLSEVM